MNAIFKKKLIYSILILSLCVFLFSIIYPGLSQYRANTDEDFDLVKPYLISQGYPLYTQTWSDQGPVFTVILYTWAKLFGFNLTSSRILIYFFSCLLLYICLHLSQLKKNTFLLFCLSCLLLSSPYFFELSSTLLIGLPALTLFYFSLSILLKPQVKKKSLYLSITLFSLSLGLKLITALYLPIIFFILIKHKGIILNQKYRHILFFFVVILPWTTLTILYPNQLFFPHFNSSKSFIAISAPDITAWLNGLWPSLCLLPLSILRKKDNTDKCLLIIILMTTISFLIQRPIWHHYVLYLSVPLNILAVKSLHYFLMKGEFSNVKKSVLLFVLLVCIFQIKGAISSFKSFLQKNNDHHQMIRKSIVYLNQNKKNDSTTILTDRPILVTETESQIDPKLAVLSLKRIATNHVTDNQVLQSIKKYQPEFICSLKDIFLGFHQTNFYIKKHYKKDFTFNRSIIFRRTTINEL